MTARGGAAVSMTAKTQAMTPTVGKEEDKDYLEDSVDAASYKRVDHKNIVRMETEKKDNNDNRD